MAQEHDRSMMENLYWWGIATMFRCEHTGPEGRDIETMAALVRSLRAATVRG